MTTPLILQTFPQDNATGVSVTSNLGFGFDQAVKAGSGYIRIYKSDGTLFHSIAITDTSQVTFSVIQPARVLINPNVDLLPGTSYYVLIDAGAIENLGGEDYAGISSPTAFNFTSAGSPPAGDTTVPLLITTSPVDDATGVAVGTNLVLTFNEAMKAGSGNIEIRKVSDGSIAMTVAITDATQIAFSGSQLTINPTSDLAGDTGYYVTFSSAVVLDLANNAFGGISSPWVVNFTTADTTAPLVISTSPVDDATDVASGANLILTFNEAVKAGSGTIEIRNASDDSIAKSVAVTDASQVSFAGNQLTINPSTDLAEGLSYYVTFGSGVVLDLADNAFAGIASPTTLNFTVPVNPNDVLIGTPDPDTLDGEDGNDTINGLTGFDTLIGGTGDDTFIISNYEGGETSILLYSETGDWVGAGQVLSLIPDVGDTFSASAYDGTGDGIVDAVYFWYHDDDYDHWWGLNFSTTQLGTNLVPGTYLNAERAAFASPGHPGLDVSGDGRGSNQVFGSFTVTEAVFDYSSASPVVVSLSINFEQHSESPDAPALYGVVNYNYVPAGPPRLDSVIEYADEGNDTVLASVSYALVANVENLTLTGYEDVNGTGNALDNVITGNSGDNVLDGAASADTMAGGYGDDTYVVDNLTDTITENPLEGTDTIQSSVTRVLDADVENLTLTGSANIDGTGNELGNTLIGNAGANVLSGGAGDDWYILGTSDAVVENSGEGTDTVEVSATHMLADNVENLTLTGTGNVNGTGNALDNVLTGNQQLPGGGGQNVLTGGNGNDTLNGRTGLDMLIGGLGDDTYIIDNYEGGETSILLQSQPGDYIGAGQILSLIPVGADNLSVSAYDGTGDGIVDAVYFWYHDDDYDHWWGLNFSTTQLGTNLVPGTYVNAERFAFASPGHPGLDVYGDGRGSNQVFGSFTVTEAVFDYSGPSPVLVSLSLSFEQHSESPAATPLFGIVSYNYAPAGPAFLDSVIENGGEGTDTVQAAMSYVLGVNLENLTLTGSDDINGTGNGLDNVINGNWGDNILDGEAGADTMAGGYGADTYVVDSPGDIVVEDWTYGGNDTVQSSVTYALDTNVENLTLTGSANINATGNEIDNNLTGNTGANVLSGGGGYNTLLGGGGNDTFNILAGAGYNVIGDFSAGAGTGDVVLLDGFVLADFGDVQAKMTQSGSNTLLDLGNGQTLVFVDLAPAALAADDFTFLNVQPGAPEPFDLPVSGAFTNTISGTRRADTLTGTSANNRLDGKQGADTMTGLAGDDTYLVNTSADVVVESSGQGIDTVISSAASYVLANNVENLTLTGTITHVATGNDLNNLIIASSRPDTINGGAGNDIIRAGTGACVLTGGAGNDMFVLPVLGSLKQITDFQIGEDLLDLRSLFAPYGGSDPVADGIIAFSAVSGGLLVSVDPTTSGTMHSLVTLSGVAMGDLGVGTDILWT